MSLATYASPFNNDENNDNKNYISKKKVNRNKTIKKENFKNNTKMNEMYKKIHNNADADSDDEEGFSNFEPIEKPSSATIENMNSHSHNSNDVSQISMEMAQKSMSEHSQENFSQLPSEYAKQYYEQYVNNNKDNNSTILDNKEYLLEKMNHIIYLLEEQQNEKTGRVTEEVVLYSFLGIFIIFIVDSFARVGKYVR